MHAHRHVPKPGIDVSVCGHKADAKTAIDLAEARRKELQLLDNRCAAQSAYQPAPMRVLPNARFLLPSGVGPDMAHGGLRNHELAEEVASHPRADLCGVQRWPWWYCARLSLCDVRFRHGSFAATRCRGSGTSWRRCA